MEKKLNEKNMVVAMSCTSDWYHYLMVDVYSLLDCTKNVKKIYLLVETSNIDDVPYLADIINKYDVDVVLVNLSNYLLSNLSETSPNRDTWETTFT